MFENPDFCGVRPGLEAGFTFGKRDEVRIMFGPKNLAEISRIWTLFLEVQRSVLGNIVKVS